MTEEELEKQRTAALEEAIRLEKLRADDFRERALNAMMDGVLNKKWQEEIKKDVVKPSFMVRLFLILDNFLNNFLG